MPTSVREFIPNQIFVGLPWRNVRKHYEKIIPNLHKKYPLYFTIVGWNDSQHATDLFEVIKARITQSSHGIFDATGGNANVSLEYGYAEGVGIPRAIFLSTHGATRRGASNPIISDLVGSRRVQYKTQKGLVKELQKFSREHPYSIRFEKALSLILRGMNKGQKKSGRALALKIIHKIDGASEVRREDILQQLAAEEYRQTWIEFFLKRLHSTGVINCSVGAKSKVRVA